jgi:hypothetical protein
MHLGHLPNDFVREDIKIVQGRAESRACCRRVVLRSSLRSLIRSKAVVEPGATGVDMIQLLFDITFDIVLVPFQFLFEISYFYGSKGTNSLMERLVAPEERSRLWSHSIGFGNSVEQFVKDE